MAWISSSSAARGLGALALCAPLVVARAEPVSVEGAYAIAEGLCQRIGRIDLGALAECAADKTFDACWQRVQAGPWPEVEVQKNENRWLAQHYKAETATAVDDSLTSLPLPGLAGALPNLLPGAAFGAVQPVVDHLDDPHTLGGVLSEAFIPVGIKRYFVDVQGKVFLAPSPRINPALKSRLIETNRADVLSAAENDAEPWDDVLYEVNVSPLYYWLGRDVHWYQESFDELAPNVIRADVPDLKNQTLADEDAARIWEALWKLKLEDPRTREAMACSARALVDHKLNREKRVQYYRLYRFGSLITNQPQLVYTRKELRRSAPIGVNVHSNRFTVSTGLMNNLVFLGADGDCGFRFDKATCPEAYREMVNSGWVSSGLGASAFYEWGTLGTFRFSIPEGSVPGTLPPPLGGAVLPAEDFEIPGGSYKYWGGSVGFVIPQCGKDSFLEYGESGDTDKAAKAGTSAQPRHTRGCRIDLAYERTTYSEKIFRIGHNVGRLTFTYRWGMAALPIHLVYREEAEFRADVTDRIGAGIGATLGW